MLHLRGGHNLGNASKCVIHSKNKIVKVRLLMRFNLHNLVVVLKYFVDGKNHSVKEHMRCLPSTLRTASTKKLFFSVFDSNFNFLVKIILTSARRYLPDKHLDLRSN